MKKLLYSECIFLMAGPDILNPQIQALGAMDEAFDENNTAQISKKGQEDWQMNLATMKS